MTYTAHKIFVFVYLTHPNPWFNRVSITWSTPSSEVKAILLGPHRANSAVVVSIVKFVVLQSMQRNLQSIGVSESSPSKNPLETYNKIKG